MRFGVFYADTQQIASVYDAPAVNLAAYTCDRPVIHADIPAWVDPTKCYLINIAGIYHAVTNVEYAITCAVSFSQRLLIKFAAENVLLGVTQMHMTATIRGILTPVIQCLQTGSLYDAMDQVRLVPPESKDETFITNVRLLGFINSIETYLGVALSTSL